MPESYKTAFLLVFFALLLGVGEVWAQTFTSNQNGNWSTAGIWTRTNPNNCGSQHTSPPPTSSYNPNCQIDVVVRNNVNYNTGSSFGGGYFKSLTVENGGVLNFPSNFTVSTSGSNVGNPIFVFSEGSLVNVTGTTTFTSSSQVTINGLSNFSSNSMILEGNTNLVIDGATVSLNDLTIRNGAKLTVINGGKLIVNNTLTMNGGGSYLTVDSSSSLTNRGTFDLQTNGTVNIAGTFNGNNFTSSSGGGGNLFAVSGSVSLSGNLTVHGYPLTLTGSGGVVVEGDIRITNSGTSSVNLNGSETDLIGLGSNNCAYYNQYASPSCSPNRTDKLPTGTGCYQVPGFPGSGSCSSSSCLQTILVSQGKSTKERIYIFKCSSNWTVPSDTVGIAGDSLEIVNSFESLIVAGGGGGGYGVSAGGGGAGAVIYNIDINLAPAANIFIEVGAGGDGGTSSSVKGKNGKDSSIGGFVAKGGGGGGGVSSTSSNRNGENGGSGGGAASLSRNNNGTGGSPIGSASSPALYYGERGGNSNSNTNFVNGAGGGGASDAGSSPPAGNGNDSNGGAAFSNSISGAIVLYGGGGGGSRSNSTDGTGGSGVGGNANKSGSGGNGQTSTGSGGGAGGTSGGKGASGVVIIKSNVYRVLPISIDIFQAVFKDKTRSSKLSWSTAKEWQNSHFEIERAVNSVANWETIGSVDGAGYSDTPLSYTFDDDRLPASGGNIFYRLKQVNLDGTFSYSVTRAIKIEPIEGTMKWIAFPNPSNGDNIQITPRDRSMLSEQSPIHVLLFNSLGQTENIPGSTLEQINQNLQKTLSQKSSGVYLIQIIHGNDMETLRIIKI